MNKLKISFITICCLASALRSGIQCMDLPEVANDVHEEKVKRIISALDDVETPENIKNLFLAPELAQTTDEQEDHLFARKRGRDSDTDEGNNVKKKKPKTSPPEQLPEYFSSGAQSWEEFDPIKHNVEFGAMSRKKMGVPITRREAYQFNHPDSFAYKSIPNQFMFSTIFISATLVPEVEITPKFDFKPLPPSGDAGFVFNFEPDGFKALKPQLSSFTPSHGTGFVFNFEPDGFLSNTYFPCLVTNRHVIFDEKNKKRADTAELIFHKRQIDKNEPCLNEEFITAKFPENFHQYWILHPDPEVDLCILPLNFFNDEKNQPFYIGIEKADIPNERDINNLSAVEEILMVGYPNTLRDHVNNLPIIRKGITGTHPSIPFKGKPEFLIDIGSFPGSSGGPVFIFDKDSFKKGENSFHGFSRQLFVGVQRAANTIKLEKQRGGVLTIALGDTASDLVRMPTHLSYVIKANVLLKFNDELAEMIARKKEPPKKPLDIKWS